MSTLGTLSPSPVFTGLDSDGNPLVGGLLYTFDSGSATPAATYTDAAMAVPNANPIVLDAAGRATIYLPSSSFKFVLKTSAGATVWTIDPVTSVVVSQAGALGEIFFFGGDASSPITDTSFPSGATYDKLHAGSSIFSVNSAVLVGTYALEAMLVGSGGTVTVGLVNLSDGAPDTTIATCASTSTTGARVVSSAITAWGAAGSTKQYGFKTKVSTGSGYVWCVRLSRTA